MGRHLCLFKGGKEVLERLYLRPALVRIRTLLSVVNGWSLWDRFACSACSNCMIVMRGDSMDEQKEMNHKQKQKNHRLWRGCTTQPRNCLEIENNSNSPEESPAAKVKSKSYSNAEVVPKSYMLGLFADRAYYFEPRTAKSQSCASLRTVRVL